MNTQSSSHCPFHAGTEPPAPPRHPPGVWPPGPRAALTGWGFLSRMSRDLLGTLAEWQQAFGDVVHLRIWPEHMVALTDPKLVRELLVTHHDALLRWERATRVFAQLHGHSVLIAEGDAWCGKRHALQPSFTPKAVQTFIFAIAAATDKALAHWPVESALTSLTMDVIVRMMFSDKIGKDARDAENAVHTTSEAADAASTGLQAALEAQQETRPDGAKWLNRSPSSGPHELAGRYLARRPAVPSSAIASGG